MTALGTLIDALRGVVDTAELEAAVDAWHGPGRRAVVVGRRSVGKSTLVNTFLGTATRPTGMGGVTREPAETSIDELVVVDTPGLEDPSAATWLAPWLADADLVVWLVDGLMPMTRTERNAVAVALPPDVPLRIGVCRLDLVDATEHAAIGERVRRLSAHLDPIEVRPADPRSDTTILLPVEPGPRLARLHSALGRVREALLALPDPPDPQRLRTAVLAAWRATVRSAAPQQPSLDAVSQLATRATEAHSRFLDDLAHDEALVGLISARGLPTVPLPPAPRASSARDTLDRLVSGAAGATREARDRLGDWLLDGELALDAWLGPPPPVDDTRRRLLARLDAATGDLPHEARYR